MPASRTPANFYHLPARLDKSISYMYTDSVTSDPFAWFDIESNHFGVGPLGSQPLSLPVSPSTPSSSSPTASLPNDTKTNGRRRDPGHIPRPRNAFILFRTEYIKGEPVEEGQTQLSKNAGTAWHNMSSEEKRPYHELAALEKEAHAKKYPGYIYAPRRKNGTNMKRNGMLRQKDRITGPLPTPPSSNMSLVQPIAESTSRGRESMESWSFPQIPLHNHSSFVDRMSMADQYVDPFGIFSAPDLTTLPPLPNGATMTTDDDVFADFISSHWSTNGKDNFEDLFPDLFGTGSNASAAASSAAATSTTATTTAFTTLSDFASSSSFDFPFSSAPFHLDPIFPDFTNSFDARQYFNL